jgi:UDPglucose 6-dehydrogenase
MGNAALVQPALRYASSVSEAAAGADAVLHLTEWTDYRAIDPAMLATVVAQRNMIDARGALDEAAWRSAGWAFRTLGRREDPVPPPVPGLPGNYQEKVRDDKLSHPRR